MRIRFIRLKALKVEQEVLFRWVGIIRASHISATLCVALFTGGLHVIHMTVNECIDYVEAFIECCAP